MRYPGCLSAVALCLMLAMSPCFGENTEQGLMLMPCDKSREHDCRGYFDSMLRYIRTFTVDYRIADVRKKNRIRALYLSFPDERSCARLLELIARDLAYAGATLEEKNQGGKRYEMLFNLNHRLMLSCIGKPRGGDR